MPTVSLTAFLRGSPARIPRGGVADVVLESRDESGVLVDVEAASAKTTITDPTGAVIVAAGAMTNEAAGKNAYYHQHATTDRRGWYKGVCEADVLVGAGTRTERAEVRWELV